MSTVLSTTAQQIIDDAYTLIRVKGFLDPLENEQEEFALRMLNSLLKQWEKEGVYIHTISDITIPLNGSKQSYTIGPSTCDVTAGRPVKLLSAARKDAEDTYNPINIVSIQEYRRIPNRDIVGEVSLVAYERGIAYGTLYVWPVNDELLAVSTRDIIGTFQRSFDIFDTSADTPDLPSEMFLTITYCLAAILVNTSPLSLAEKQSIKAEATMLFAKLRANDTENVSFFFQPDVRRR